MSKKLSDGTKSTFAALASDHLRPRCADELDDAFKLYLHDVCRIYAPADDGDLATYMYDAIAAFESAKQGWLDEVAEAEAKAEDEVGMTRDELTERVNRLSEELVRLAEAADDFPIVLKQWKAASALLRRKAQMGGTEAGELTDEELDHERECCRRFIDAQRNYIRIVEAEPDEWLKANAALEELWAAYQASPCACATKPQAEAA